ncbi:hypothetical protein [Flavobacterium yafengii]|uniref:hypothetical protein n=1 Tax=Flavobacterium yafengii TaxID=3041253 RepID=UPI0024A82E04|nr:hypothetical protein [Flavobacterium yafengii]MDI5897709.1 hypothetical protein [Flavobacterium yafengii]
MKQISIILFLLTYTITFGQIAYEPQILILAPNATKYEKALEKEVTSYNKEIKKKLNVSELEQTLNTSDFKKQPENIQIITKCEIEFSKDLDFFKQASFISEQYLVYRFFEKFPNLLIKLKDDKSNGTLEELKTQSNKEKLQYVLNLSSIELYVEKKNRYAKISVQLYDNVSNSILLDKAYIGDWRNQGFEFSCEDKTINCTLNNALSQALGEVIYTIASNSPTLKREKQLKQERFDVLMKSQFNQYYDKQQVKNIISPVDSNINIDIAYQALFSNDKSKFVAFFLEQVSAQDFKTLKDNKKDKNVNIISSKDIKDDGFLDDIPKTYAYIVKGVKYEDKWYYEKSNVTYFEAKTLNDGQQNFFNNLQKWNFFKENSTEFNPDFWETELFKKVTDLKKDPDWEKYAESMWKTDEINNRPYIGLYDIVVNKMQEAIEKDNLEFDKKKKELFTKFYENLKSKDSKTYNKISEHSLIYPTDKSVVINPTLITSKEGIKTIHYFVILDNQNNIFEWNYFEPKVVIENLYGSQVVDQISSLTDWNFSVDNLNDSEFWNKYVLLKTEAKYKYLTEIR